MMSPISSILRPFRNRKTKRLGKVLFLTGAGLLSFSSTSLLGYGDYFINYDFIQVPGIIFFVMVSSFVLLLTGESILALARSLEPRSSLRVRPLRLVRSPERKQAAAGRSKCSFCERSFVPPAAALQRDAPHLDTYEVALSLCMRCGKIACPRCAYIKGMEMDLKSLCCPGCGAPLL